MRMTLKTLRSHPRHQEGAFLVIALILIVVLSALGIAMLSMTVSSERVGRNLSKYTEAKAKAITMAAYGKKILASYSDGQYPGPATCNSTATCNVIVNTFPQSGRPTLVWTSGITDSDLNSKQSDSWWTSHGFGFEGTFSGSGNARVIVYRLGSSSSYPYINTYKIVGYGTDSTGNAQATQVLYHTWLGYTPDPYPNTSGTNLYSNSSCTGGCPYGQCCNGSTCSTDSTSCASASATYTPPGWLCSDYFVTGLGYNSTTCNNATAKVLDVFKYSESAKAELQAWYTSHGSAATALNASSLSFDKYYSNNTLDAVYAYYCGFFPEFQSSLTGSTGTGVVFYFNSVTSDGYLNWVCRRAGNPTLPLIYLPPTCTATGADDPCNCPDCGGPVIVP